MIRLQTIHSDSPDWNTFVQMSAIYIKDSWPNTLEGASVDTFAESYANSLKEHLANGGRYLWLLRHQDRCVGLANVYIERTQPPEAGWPMSDAAHVAEFYIIPETRRQGLGAAAFDAICRQCRQLGASWVGAEVDGDQREANAFWSGQNLKHGPIARGCLYWRSLIGYGLNDDLCDLATSSPPKRVELLWVRHGAIKNVDDARLWPQDHDLKLSASSVAAARQLGAILQLDETTPLFTSTLRRALETADAMGAAGRSVCVLPCPELQEFFPSELVGLSDEQAQQKYGVDYLLRMKTDANAMFKGSESAAAALHRSLGILRSIARLPLAASRRCVISHGTLFHLVACALQGRPLTKLYKLQPPGHLVPQTLVYNWETDTLTPSEAL